MRVTVFGGSSPKPGEPAYQEAYRLGQLLGAEGFTLLTGGYMGTMEAASRGAAEAGAHVIGVTCDEIEAWRPARPNAWVKEEMRFVKLRDRLYTLMEQCDAALALPGGVGTLAEISTMWSQMQTGAMLKKPLILIGAGWRAVFDELCVEQDAYIPSSHRDFLLFASDVESAFSTLQSLIPNP